MPIARNPRPCTDSNDMGGSRHTVASAGKRVLILSRSTPVWCIRARGLSAKLAEALEF
jgi:hypothetical protein